MADDSKDSEQEKYYALLRKEKEGEISKKEKEELKEKTKKEIHKAPLSEQVNYLLDNLKKDFAKGNVSIIRLILLPVKFLGIFLNVVITAIKDFILKHPILGWAIILVILSPFWLFIISLITGGGTSILGTQLSVLIAKTPISAITTPVYNFWTDPIGTIATFGTFKSPETVEKRKPQGVEIKNFQTKKPIHRPELDKIETVANVKIYALEDSPTQVKFSCEKEDPLSTDFVFGGSSAEVLVSGELEDSVYVFENQDKSVNVQCEFKEASKIAYDAFGKIDRQKTIQEKITLKANYEDFIVRSRLKVYKLESSALSLIENAGSNPFTEFNIRDPLVSANDRSVRPEQLKSGPVILSLTIIDAQPLTEGLTYLLGIELSNDKLGWNGKISRLKSLNLFFPNGFSPVETRCPDFDRKENNVLGLNTLALIELSKREIDKERFFCDFTIDSSAVTESLDYSLIHAEAKFDYTFEAYTTATISQGLIQSTTTTTKA